MTQEPSVRARLISEGIRLFRDQGYHGTGIQQIATAAGIPKGSFNYYFASKEALAAAVIAEYGDAIAQGLLVYGARVDLSPGERLTAYFSDMMSELEGSGFAHGCTIGNLLAEIGDVNERLRKDLQTAWNRIADALTHLVVEAEANGEMALPASARIIACHLLTGWEGALIAMRAEQSAQPMARFIALSLNPLMAANRNTDSHQGAA